MNQIVFLYTSSSGQWTEIVDVAYYKYDKIIENRTVGVDTELSSENWVLHIGHTLVYKFSQRSTFCSQV